MTTELEQELIDTLKAAQKELQERYDTYVTNGSGQEPYTKEVLEDIRKVLKKAGGE